ncbi:MAG: hypothetical protein G01um101448_368 [Parcubacteria group bacterium Gr01-1014_48]|nr:MAG: hypothetical protein Greene041614_240 [Parcubacteria group bacterium Greene0416_14]TSC74065.1 MAG: hypothetical protein G01um101448_368 [Parcubacteria group bacterium Gr01-1014_48]TSD01147.1 MAG: hypothetical protein Greene101415_450 [Parcubacteria group bacterium Greene1014_15]TSD08223.1 MAG: hypothetical protein Greene07144_293 [Parcubacteria group bacterium Greene0714_4]
MQNNADREGDRDFFVSEWLKHVADDELNAQASMKDRDGTPAQVCFLSQQMAEKSLKAFLLHFTGDYPKMHGLPQILVMLDVHVSGIVELLKEDVIILNPYYITTRYVADVPLESFTWEMAEEAFSAAERIKTFVLQKLAKPDQKQDGFSMFGIILIFAGLLVIAVGVYFLEISPKSSVEMNDEKQTCTQDAKLCPDGSYVSRTGPNCAFAPCLDGEVKSEEAVIDTSDWKTYRNEEYGFELKYPVGLDIIENESHNYDVEYVELRGPEAAFYDYMAIGISTPESRIEYDKRCAGECYRFQPLACELQGEMRCSEYANVDGWAKRSVILSNSLRFEFFTPFDFEMGSIARLDDSELEDLVSSGRVSKRNRGALQLFNAVVDSFKTF